MVLLLLVIFFFLIPIFVFQIRFYFLLVDLDLFFYSDLQIFFDVVPTFPFKLFHIKQSKCPFCSLTCHRLSHSFYVWLPSFIYPYISLLLLFQFYIKYYMSIDYITGFIGYLFYNSRFSKFYLF